MSVTSRQQAIDVRSSAPAQLTTNQGVLLAGFDYAARREQHLAQYSPAGNVFGWPNLGAGETPDTATATVYFKNGAVAYFVDTSVPPTITRGAVLNNDPSRIVHNSGTTIWAGSTRTTIIDVLVGDAVRLESPVGTMFYTRVAGIEYGGTSDAIVLVLSDPVPAAMRSGYFNVALAAVNDFVVPPASLTLSTTQIQVAASIVVTTSRTGVPCPVLPFLDADNTTPLSDLFVDYRAERTSSTVMTTTTVVTAANLNTLFVGAEYPESELGHAAYLALKVQTENVVLSANVAPVLVRAPLVYTTAAFQTMLSSILLEPTYAVIVPLSTNTTIIDDTRNMVASRNVNTSGLHTHMFMTRALVSGTPSTRVMQFIADVNYDNQDVVAVFPPFFVDTPDHIAIAAVAALRTLAVPGYAISFLELPFEQEPIYRVYANFAKVLVNAGVLVVSQSPTTVPKTVVLRDATTDTYDELTLSEGMVSLTNAVRRALYASVEPLIGSPVGEGTAVAIASSLIRTLMSIQSWLEMSTSTGGLSFMSRSPSIRNFSVGTPVLNNMIPTQYDVDVTFEVWHFVFDAKITVQAVGASNG